MGRTRTWRKDQRDAPCRRYPRGRARHATKARFVNRQKGSGSRAWFDRLLGQSGIRPDEIVGYGLEEFTHQPVIASGAADAGRGARAAAERFGLGFVSVGWEVYGLAASASLPGDGLDRVQAMLRERVGAIPGYRLPG